MNLLKDWGFSWEGWRHGTRGEYWVLAQALLALGFVLLPIYRLPGLLVVRWEITTIAGGALLTFGALTFFKGFWDLGQSLTPLPYPREDGKLVQTGVYGGVRHPIYSGLILGGLGWAIAQLSLTHFVGAIAIFLFFNAKANREEIWLKEKYSDYSEYCQRVKKLIPGIY